MAEPSMFPRVAPSGAQSAFQNHGGSPGAFGLHRARSLQMLGQNLEQGGLALFEAAEKRRREANDLMVTEAGSTLARRLATRYGEFTGRLGKSAQDGLTDYQSYVDAELNAILATLPDDETREAFRRSNQNMVDRYWIQGQDHATGQMRTWASETTKSVQAEMQQQAVLAGTDVAAVRDYVKRGADALMAYNISVGIDADMAGRDVRKYIGESYYQVIRTLLDQNKLNEAESVFNEFKGEMNAESIVKAQTALSTPLLHRDARTLVDGAINPYSYSPESPISRNEYVIGDSHGEGIRRAANLQGWTQPDVSITSPAVRQQLAKAPDGSRVFVSLGMADLRHGASVESVLDAAGELMKDARERNIDMIWLGPPVSDKAWNERTAELDAGLSALAADYGVEYRSMQESSRDLERLPDGIHYTPQSYRTMFGNSADRRDVSAYINLPTYFTGPERRAISTVAPTLQQIVARAAQISSVQFHVPPETAGRRTQAQQNELVSMGWSRAQNSHHLRGDAIDIWPVRPDGTPDADWSEGYAEITRAMRQAASEMGVTLTWGGDWTNFRDPPHWQLGPAHRSQGNQIAGQVGTAILNAANRHGVPANVMMRIAMLESSGNPRASNPNSSAKGLFQFIDSTARQYGLTNPFDAAANADAAARLLKDNANALRSALGREPEGWELYLAHQQGSGGAIKLLSNPDAPAASVVGEDAVLLNGGRAGMTAGEFAALWRDRYNNVQGGFAPSVDTTADVFANQAVVDTSPAAAFREQAGMPPVDVPLPEAVPPVQYGMPDKGEALQRILEETADNPVLQDAAITELNRRYTEWETATAARRGELTQNVKDLTAAAADGAEGITFPYDEVRYYFPPQKADAIIAEYEVSAAVGRLVQASRWASPADIQQLSADVNSGKGFISSKIDEFFPLDGSIENYRLQERLRTSFNNMIQRRTEALQSDPALYVQQEPVVQSARQRMEANPSPENWRTYAETVLAVQEHLGVGPEEQHILTKLEASAVARRVTNPQTSAVGMLQELQETAGPLWNQYFTDLASLGELPTAYQLLALLPEPKDAELLERALRDMVTAEPKLDWNTVLGPDAAGDGRSTVTAIDTYVQANAELKQYIHGMINSNGVGAADMVAEIVESINTLAYANAFYKRLPAVTAAQNAVDAFLGQFEFLGSGDAVIPKQLAPGIRTRAQAFLDNLDGAKYQLALQEGLDVLGAPSLDEVIRNVQADPVWITNQLSTGLYLSDPVSGDIFRWRDGTPVEIPFEASMNMMDRVNQFGVMYYEQTDMMKARDFLRGLFGAPEPSQARGRLVPDANVDFEQAVPAPGDPVARRAQLRSIIEGHGFSSLPKDKQTEIIEMLRQWREGSRIGDPNNLLPDMTLEELLRFQPLSDAELDMIDTFLGGN